MNEQEIDLLELWQVLNNNKRKIAYITGGFIALSCAYLIIVPPTYQSTSLLRIKQDKGLSDSILSQMPLGNTQMTQQKMNTNAEILKSRNVVIPVIKATEGLKDGKYPDYDAYVKSHITTKPFKDTEILQLDVTGGTPEKRRKRTGSSSEDSLPASLIFPMKNPAIPGNSSKTVSFPPKPNLVTPKTN